MAPAYFDLIPILVPYYLTDRTDLAGHQLTLILFQSYFHPTSQIGLTWHQLTLILFKSYFPST